MAKPQAVLTGPPSHPDDVSRTLGLDGSGGRRRWLGRASWIALAALTVAAGVRLLSPSGEAPVAYVTEPAEIGELTVVVTATGTLEPVDAVDVGPEITGRVADVFVDVNDRVEAGQPLVALDTEVIEAETRRVEAQLALARTSLARAQVDHEDAQRTLARVEALAKRGVVAAQERDAAQTQAARAAVAIDQARAEIRSAEASLNRARIDLDRAVVRAPAGGIVLSRAVEPGQTVVTSLQSPVLFRLAAGLEHMEASVAVDEADIGPVAVGQAASFTVAAHLDERFPARVVSVHNAPTTVNGVVTYEALLAVDNDRGLLKPGMTVTAEIVTQQYDDVLLVPNAALRFTPAQPDDSDDRPTSGRAERATSGTSGPNGARHVWVLTDGAPVAVEVTTGPSDGTHTIVTGGELSAGTPVIVNTRQE
ncbi:efflux RND transporter periplasmic adaptor subunit [Haliangium sp.]|uniref:efflux RND transporter periplasmic adaptor subunit n=1 Tax=Haliangium sp. TaxID=2663208 RepID=UPI003D09EC67